LRHREPPAVPLAFNEIDITGCQRGHRSEGDVGGFTPDRTREGCGRADLHRQRVFVPMKRVWSGAVGARRRSCLVLARLVSQTLADRLDTLMPGQDEAIGLPEGWPVRASRYRHSR
jgi:hypothetical protein